MTTPVAIIGFACRLAGAGTSAELWARLNSGLEAGSGTATGTGPGGLVFTPEEQLAGQFPGQSFAPGFRWPPSLLRQVEIDPADFGMAPETAREIDSLPLLGMSLVREALLHAGSSAASASGAGMGMGTLSSTTSAMMGQPFPGGGGGMAGTGVPCAEERAGLVLGFSHSSTARPTTPAQSYASAAAAVTEGGGAGVAGGFGDGASSSSLSTSNLNTSAGTPSDNEAAVQMIAQTMGLRGLHGAVDSGPTAGLAAIQLAVDELESGRCDLMVAGGVQLLPDAERQAVIDAAAAAALAATAAAQQGPYTDSRPWGQHAPVPEEEGLAVVVLKRLSEAHRDGDRVWGVIRGAGSASQTDGTGRSRIVAAALKAWQGACQEAGLRPDGAEFVEVQSAMPGAEVVPLAWMGWHGLAAATEKAPRCVVATPAPLYSRLGAAMGVCGMIRLALSLHHKLLPPGAFGQAGGGIPPAAVAAAVAGGGSQPANASQSLAGVLAANVTHTIAPAPGTAPRPWFSVPGRERLAGLWSHNPNGTHYCFVLEESHPSKVEPVRADSVEIFAFSAKSSRPLISQLKELDKAFNAGITAQALATRAADSRIQFSRQHQNRLVFVSRDARELRRQIRIALEFLPLNPAESWALPENIFHGYGPPPGRVAMLFPDAAAASQGMASNAVCTFPVAFDVIGHTELQTGVESPLLADRIYPWPMPPVMEGHSTSRPPTHQSGKVPPGLSSPDTAQPAVTVASLAMLGMLQQFEVDANAVAGAGCGELAALAAAGCFDRATLLFLAAMRGRCLTEFHLMHDLNEPGAALSIRAPLETIRRVLREERLNLGLRQQQTAWIVFGPRPEVLRAQRICLQRAIVSDEVPLASLPNAAQEAPMRALWQRNVESLDIAPPRVAVYAPGKSGVMPLPEDSTQLRAHLLGQAVESGTLREAIRQLYQDGTRIFLEIGPGTTLTREVREELGEHPHAAISLEAEDPAPQEHKTFPGGMIPLARALAQLAALGSHVRLELWPSPSHPSLFHDVTQVRPTTPGRLLVPLIQLPPGAVPVPAGRAGGRTRQEGSRRASASASANGGNGAGSAGGDGSASGAGRSVPPPSHAAPYYHPHPTHPHAPHPVGTHYHPAQIPGVPPHAPAHGHGGAGVPPAAETSLIPGTSEVPGTYHVLPPHIPGPLPVPAHPLAGPPRDAADILLEREYAATHETLRQLHAHTAEMFKQFLANQEAAQRAVQELYRTRVQQIEAQRTAAAMEQAHAERSGAEGDGEEDADGDFASGIARKDAAAPVRGETEAQDPDDQKDGSAGGGAGKDPDFEDQDDDDDAADFAEDAADEEDADLDDQEDADADDAEPADDERAEDEDGDAEDAATDGQDDADDSDGGNVEATGASSPDDDGTGPDGMGISPFSHARQDVEDEDDDGAEDVQSLESAGCRSETARFPGHAQESDAGDVAHGLHAETDARHDSRGHDAWDAEDDDDETEAETPAPPEFCDIVVEDFRDLLAIQCDYPRDFLDDELTLDEDLGVDAPRLEEVWQNLLLRHPNAQRPPPAAELGGARLGQVVEVLRALNLVVTAEIPPSSEEEAAVPGVDTTGERFDSHEADAAAAKHGDEAKPQTTEAEPHADSRAETQTDAHKVADQETSHVPDQVTLNVPASPAPASGSPSADTPPPQQPLPAGTAALRPNAITKPFSISPFLNVLPSPGGAASGGGQQSEGSGGVIRRPRPTSSVGGMVRTSSPSGSAGGGNSGAGSAGMNLGPRLHIGVALGLALVMERDVSLETHPFLRSHILRDRPVLPLSVGLNWMAEAALRHSPEMQLHGCRNFRALRPVALDGHGDTFAASQNERESESERGFGLRLRLAAGAAQRKSNGLYEVPVELQSEQEQAYYRATVLLSQTAPPQAPVPLLPNLAARPYPRTVRDAMETLLFHGPAFHGIETIHGLGPRGISGSVRPSPEPTTWMTSPASQHWHADPLLLEGSVQLLMLWSIENLQAPCRGIL